MQLQLKAFARLRGLVVACLPLVAAACEAPVSQPAAQPAPPSVESAPSTETLRLVAAGDAAPGEVGAVAVDLVFSPAPGAPAPRMLELRLRTTGLAFKASAPLAAVEAAGKRLVVQEEGADTLRLIVFASDNLTTLGAGPLARLRFDPAGPGAATVSIVSEPPVFAPVEANAGLKLGAPLTLRGAP